MPTFSCLFKPALILLLLPLASLRSHDHQIPNAYTGVWKTEPTKITVRKKTGWMKYAFVSNRVTLSLKIDSGDKAGGSIGTATFENAPIRQNKGNPSFTGIAYIVRCEGMGKLFENDPLCSKTVELWFKPAGENGKLTAEIRLKDGWEPFPMGECIFVKQPK